MIQITSARAASVQATSVHTDGTVGEEGSGSPPATNRIPVAPHPGQVLDILRRHMLVDGYPTVIDLERSHGSWLVDALTGREYLDLFTFFASAPVGHNHPRLCSEAMIQRLGRIAVNNPSNSDFYTVEMAQFVDTLYTLAAPPSLFHLFMVAGGGPAVENALKTAFDWKARKNRARGDVSRRGLGVIHFAEAFHGRLGYSLSITATPDPRKTRDFPAFDWPRIPNPKLAFPLDDATRRDVEARERAAVAAVERALVEHPAEIAAIIIEPIQGEGGDNHFRGAFLRELRRLADAHEALLVFDEVQTGVGLTGAMWAHQHFDVEPDILVFGKKLQVCGICVSERIDDVGENVFVESSRLNSTWGGNLIDMVRATELLRIIDEERLVANARARGEQLLEGITALAVEFEAVVHNPRGRGLMCAFDLAPGVSREALLASCLDRRLILAPTGRSGVRFRPALNVAAREIDEGLERLRDALRALRAGT
jgi:L-lysine 6-transaminase